MFDVLTRLLSTTLIMATPMLVAAMGTLFIERSGIINIGNEGFMIMGALMGDSEALSGAFFRTKQGPFDHCCPGREGDFLYLSISAAH